MSSLRTRQNVFGPGGDWADPILWYARGVKAMKARRLDEPTSWTFFAAIHGIERWLWDHFGFTATADPAPGTADTAAYLNQCQHQSWYFMPWHRGYLLALENVIRREIEILGGPHETWALSYWNYFAAGQNILPPAFRTPNWPDGTGDNPLFVVQRWGPMGGASPYDIGADTNLFPMNDPSFTGPGGGGGVGFGGPVTGFSWSGTEIGGIENDPHNTVHGRIGGSSPSEEFPSPPFPPGIPLTGAMSNPRTAALDPVFYLHHCNLDRLWESWNAFPPGKPSADPGDWQNPSDPKWLGGPASIGEREFALPNPDGSKWVYTPAEMVSIAALGYNYDDLTPSAVTPAVTVAERMSNLGIRVEGAVPTGGMAMPSQTRVELVGAGEGLSLAGSDVVRSDVRPDPAVRRRVEASLEGAGAAPSVPDRVFLNLENVTGLSDATTFRVYVGAAGGADPIGDKDHLAGSVALFGVSRASDPGGEHAGNGLTYTLEITPIVDRLHLGGAFGAADLSVYLAPLDPVPESARVRIGRISIFRQFE